MSAKAHVTYFGLDGKPVGNGGELFLPDYLDWMDIDAKVFWFLERGLGEPNAAGLLFVSQGQQKLAPIDQPLRQMKLNELKEIENGLEQRVNEFCTREGISRSPRNQ